MSPPRQRHLHDERRRDPRVHLRLPVLIEAGGRKRLRRTVDISCGGARIAFDGGRLSQPHGPIRLSFRRPSAPPLELVGIVVWHSPGSYGVRFLVADELQRLAVAELIDDGLRGIAA
ncbi:MAG: PilZ domain-containing protein [Myxococcales bacterium]|nr:PilZ domain-containing protein [Myxococcales bacterium]